MDKKRLQELAGIGQLNEDTGMKSLLVKHIADIVIKHATTTDKDFFAKMSQENVMEQVEEMVVEQFDVLKEDLAKPIIKNIKLSLYGD